MDTLDIEELRNIFIQIDQQFRKIYSARAKLAYLDNSKRIQVVKRYDHNSEHFNQFLENIFNGSSTDLMSYELIPGKDNIDTLIFECSLEYVGFEDCRRIKTIDSVSLTITHERVAEIYDKYHKSDVA